MTHGLGFTQLQASALGIGPQVVCGASGTIVWLHQGLCNVPVAACLGCGGLAGTVLGVNIATRLPDAALKLAFAGCLCFIISPLSIYSAMMSAPETEDEDEAALSNQTDTVTEQSSVG